jgi:hypothetical protein
VREKRAKEKEAASKQEKVLHEALEAFETGRSEQPLGVGEGPRGRSMTGSSKTPKSIALLNDEVVDRGDERVSWCFDAHFAPGWTASRDGNGRCWVCLLGHAAMASAELEALASPQG